MKKSIMAIVAGVALALALPTMAFAASSPSSDYKTTTAASGDSSVTAVYEAGSSTDWLVVDGSSTPSSTASLISSSETTVGTYEVYMHAGDDSSFSGSATLTFNVGASNAGKTAKIYVVHGRDASGSASLYDTKTVDSNGNVTITISGLSYYTVTLSGTASGSSDGSSKSPSTGASPLTVVLATGAALICAAGVTLVARRKMYE